MDWRRVGKRIGLEAGEAYKAVLTLALISIGLFVIVQGVLTISQ